MLEVNRVQLQSGLEEIKGKVSRTHGAILIKKLKRYWIQSCNPEINSLLSSREKFRKMASVEEEGSTIPLPERVVLDLDETLVCAYETSSLPAALRTWAVEGGLTCFELESLKESDGNPRVSHVRQSLSVQVYTTS